MGKKHTAVKGESPDAYKEERLSDLLAHIQHEVMQQLKDREQLKKAQAFFSNVRKATKKEADALEDAKKHLSMLEARYRPSYMAKTRAVNIDPTQQLKHQIREWSRGLHDCNEVIKTKKGELATLRKGLLQMDDDLIVIMQETYQSKKDEIDALYKRASELGRKIESSKLELTDAEKAAKDFERVLRLESKDKSEAVALGEAIVEARNRVARATLDLEAAMICIPSSHLLEARRKSMEDCKARIKQRDLMIDRLRLEARSHPDNITNILNDYFLQKSRLAGRQKLNREG